MCADGRDFRGEFRRGVTIPGNHRTVAFKEHGAPAPADPALRWLRDWAHWYESRPGAGPGGNPTRGRDVDNEQLLVLEGKLNARRRIYGAALNPGCGGARPCPCCLPREEGAQPQRPPALRGARREPQQSQR